MSESADPDMMAIQSWDAREFSEIAELTAERDALSELLRAMARRSAMYRAFHQEAIRLGRVAHASANARAQSALADVATLRARVADLEAALSGVLDAWNDQNADLVAALDHARATLEAK